MPIGAVAASSTICSSTSRSTSRGLKRRTLRRDRRSADSAEVVARSAGEGSVRTSAGEAPRPLTVMLPVGPHHHAVRARDAAEVTGLLDDAPFLHPECLCRARANAEAALVARIGVDGDDAGFSVTAVCDRHACKLLGAGCIGNRRCRCGQVPPICVRSPRDVQGDTPIYNIRPCSSGRSGHNQPHRGKAVLSGGSWRAAYRAPLVILRPAVERNAMKASICALLAAAMACLGAVRADRAEDRRRSHRQDTWRRWAGREKLAACKSLRKTGKLTMPGDLEAPFVPST